MSDVFVWGLNLTIKNYPDAIKYYKLLDKDHGKSFSLSVQSLSLSVGLVFVNVSCFLNSIILLGGFANVQVWL